jgi:hypothetical protein
MIRLTLTSLFALTCLVLPAQAQVQCWFENYTVNGKLVTCSVCVMNGNKNYQCSGG